MAGGAEPDLLPHPLRSERSVSPAASGAWGTSEDRTSSPAAACCGVGWVFFRPSCFENNSYLNNNGYLKHTKEKSVLKILQKMMSVWVFRKPEITVYGLFLLIPVYIRHLRGAEVLLVP